MQAEIRAKVLELLGAQIDLKGLSDESDLYDAGLTSFASVQLMLALEDHFGVEFPERMQNRRTFSSIANILASVDELAIEKAA
jgi:acyl carrier protein